MTMQVTASPEAVGMSASSIHEAQALIEAAVGRTKLAGAVLIVARGDQLVLLASVGLRDREAGAAMEPDAIFRIASMTKPIVSVATLMLVEAGSLRLDDQVGSYLPELADVQVFAGVENGQAILVAAERPMTIFQLLTHTSGLVYGPLHPALAAAYDILGDEPSDLAELIRRLGARPLAHQPGAEWTYGWSHDVLGRLIEVVADHALTSTSRPGSSSPWEWWTPASTFRPRTSGESRSHTSPSMGPCNPSSVPFRAWKAKRGCPEALACSRPDSTICASAGCSFGEASWTVRDSSRPTRSSA